MTPNARLGLVLAGLDQSLVRTVLVLYHIAEAMPFTLTLLLFSFLFVWEPTSVPHLEAHRTR